MSKHKHTTGPWKAGNEYHGTIDIERPDGAPIAEVYSLGYPNGHPASEPVREYDPKLLTEHIYNARLMAAAPDLLEALKDAEALAQGYAIYYRIQYQLPGFHPTHAEILGKIKSAIKKAEGEAK